MNNAEYGALAIKAPTIGLRQNEWLFQTRNEPPKIAKNELLNSLYFTLNFND